MLFRSAGLAEACLLSTCTTSFYGESVKQMLCPRPRDAWDQRERCGEAARHRVGHSSALLRRSAVLTSAGDGYRDDCQTVDARIVRRIACVDGQVPRHRRRRDHRIIGSRRGFAASLPERGGDAAERAGG